MALPRCVLYRLRHCFQIRLAHRPHLRLLPAEQLGRRPAGHHRDQCHYRQLQRLRRPRQLGAQRDADPRHATLRATIAWSHDLLTPEEQAVFRRLAVFTGYLMAGWATVVALVTNASWYE